MIDIPSYSDGWPLVLRIIDALITVFLVVAFFMQRRVIRRQRTNIRAAHATIAALRGPGVLHRLIPALPRSTDLDTENRP